MAVPNKHRLIRAFLKQPIDRTPIWIMRQAGRYLPEYRKLREQHTDFVKLFKTPELACEITLQPLQRFPLDAAIIYSDILTIPDAMGLPLSFVKGYGPQFANPIRHADDIKQLSIPDPSQSLKYVLDLIRLVKHECADRVPVIGFAGAPWTLATYMIEGSGSKTFANTKNMLYSRPELLHQLLDKITQATILYLNAQIEAGVDAIMLFDTWGGILSPTAYEAFSLQYMQRIMANLHSQQTHAYIPKIIFAKNANSHLEKIASSGCEAIGIDWTIDVAEAKQRVGQQVALQGNLDPCILYAQKDVIRHHVGTILERYADSSGHVFNLGHGIHPDVDPEKVAILIESVHELSANIMIIQSKFNPAWWLTNPHLQTIWPVVARNYLALPLKRERLELPDGDFIDLDWIGEAGKPIVMVLHGLGGSSQSTYVQGVMHAINAAGWRGVLIHFRGCSGEPNRLPHSYHLGYTEDIDYLAQVLKEREPKVPIAALGYSLGGNVLLKWLAETQENNPLETAIAVSVPFEPHKASRHIQQGFAKLYQWWFLRHLREEVKQKFSQISAPIDFGNVDEVQSMWDFDNKITAPLHGFSDAQDHYSQTSSRQHLKQITTPTLIIHSIDDPFMPQDIIPEIDELSPQITLELSKSGGHVGFITGNIPGDSEYWLEQRIPEYLSRFFET